MKSSLTYISLLVGFFHLGSIFGHKSQFRSDYKYFDKAEGWLKLQQIPANWEEAKLICHLEGAKLASPVHFMKLAMMELLSEADVSSAIFTGINALYSRGDYHTIEGVHISQIPIVWAKGQPDNYEDSESCIVMSPRGTMGDVKCDNTYPYICYKKNENIVMNNCGTTDPEYKIDSRTGSCYKMHHKGQTWMQAHMTCTAEGGHLAVINSAVESQVLMELYRAYPENIIKDKFWDDVAFIGFMYWNDTSEFYTIHGTTLEQAGFSRFAPDPKNTTKQDIMYYCGGIWRSGLLEDIWCWNKQPFICEKSPGSLVPRNQETSIYNNFIVNCVCGI